MTQIYEQTVETKSEWLSKPMQGALWKVFSCGCFAGINAIVHYLAGGGSVGPENALPTNVIMFFQNVLGTLFLLPFFLKSGRKSGFSSLKTRYPWLHFLRVLAAVAGVGFWYLALKTMPIADGVALTFTGPILTVIGAWLLLGEALSAKKIIAVFLSILGAFIISRPDLALLGKESMLGWAALFPLLSAAALAWNKLLTRKLATHGESPELLATYLLLFMAPVSLIPALFEWTMPNLNHWPWLIALGVLAAGAHLSFGKAYRLAEVTFLTPFGFSKFFFSTLLGFICFLEIPTSRLWLGMTIISLSIFVLAYKMPLYSTAKRFKSS